VFDGIQLMRQIEMKKSLDGHLEFHVLDGQSLVQGQNARGLAPVTNTY
jgi:hypothetical protein